MSSNIEQILNKLPGEISNPLRALSKEFLDPLEEIRIKAYGDVRIISSGKEYVVGLNNTDVIDSSLLNEIINNLLDYSYYAYDEELAKGYITIEGGHRVGICGKTVIDKGRVTLIKEFSSLNIRRTREIKGAAEKIIDHVLADRVNNTLVVSPPKCGKTTLLRDIIRILSNNGIKVGVCDERSEIAGTYMGKVSFDLGPRTDILDGCPKAEGMIMLIRAMSPDVIVTDEIGTKEDIEAVEAALCAGVGVITTIHGNSYNDVLDSDIGSIVKKGVFKKVIFLTNTPKTGSVKEVINV